MFSFNSVLVGFALAVLITYVLQLCIVCHRVLQAYAASFARLPISSFIKTSVITKEIQ